jgi:hypothetical protein
MIFNMILHTLIAIIIFLIILIIFLIKRGIYLIKRIENIESMLTEYSDRENDTVIALNYMLKTMQDIDIRGSFESDDEVGSVFTELKRIIEVYNNL